MFHQLVKLTTTARAADVEGESPAATDASGPEQAAADEQVSPGTDPFLFPEERLQLLLAQHGGRMWQQDVATEMEYAVSTVSELLSEMEADGQVNRYWKDGRKAVATTDLGPPSIRDTP